MTRRKLKYGDFVNEWLLEKKDYVKESTYANYMNIVYNHLIPKLGNYQMSDITNKMLQEFIMDKYREGRLYGDGGLSLKTVKDISSIIKATFKYAIRNNLIDYIDLDFYYPKVISNKKICVFNKSEERKFVNYVMNNLSTESLGLLLTIYSGLRIGELCALKWKDIDFNRNLLIVNKTLQRIYMKDIGCTKIVITNPKTSNATREIPLNREFVMLLRRFKSENDDYVLSGKSKWIEPRTYRKYYKRVIKEIGVNDISFHSLRHTFATNCIRLGADYKTVSELLGHSSVNITLNIYVHPQFEQKKKCINSLYRDSNFLMFSDGDK